MTFSFTPATREQAKARIALEGPSGTGKTYTALTLATAMADRVALIDTERGSASKYALGKSGTGFSFDTLQMTTFDPRDLVAALAAAGSAGYGCVIVDSLSHFWMGTGGMLELVDAIGKRSGGNWGGWKEARPFERQMIDALLAYPGHVVVTMRTKTEWVIEENEKGKKQPRKIGTKAEQREGIDFEFDIVGDLDQENTLVVSKSRCPALSGAVINRPGPDMAAAVLEWLNDGAEVPDPAEYLGRAMADDATANGLATLHTEVSRRQLLGAAVLHPTTGVPSTLGDVIVERGRALRAAENQRPPAQDADPAPAPAPVAAAPTTSEAAESEDADADREPTAAGISAAGGERATPPQKRAMGAMFTELEVRDRTRRLALTSAIVGREVPSANDLTAAEAGHLLSVLDRVVKADDRGAEIAEIEKRATGAAA